MLKKTGIAALLALACCALGASARERLTLNIVLDDSDEAQGETYLTVKKSGDVVRVDWVDTRNAGSQASPKPAGIFYSRAPNGGDTSKYTRVNNLETDNALVTIVPGAVSKRYIRFVPENNNIGAGVYYCIIAYRDGDTTYYSNYFELKVASASAPVLKDPKAMAGGYKPISELTPVFSWNPVDGVPYYHIILSDEPLPITDIMDGGGLLDISIIWQAITPNTRITYGAPDPSNTITAAPPPLSPGKEYSWLVFNNYGNHMAFSDGNVIDIPGTFRITGKPLNEPKALYPVDSSKTINDDSITFKWDNLDTAANSYLVNLFAYTTPDMLGMGDNIGDMKNAEVNASMLVWETTVSRGGKKQNESLTAGLNAKNVLTGDYYVWRVYALDSRGAATTGDLSKGIFKYGGAPAGKVAVRTFEVVGGVTSDVGYVELRNEVISGPMQAPLAFYTNANGRQERDFPGGTYRITAVKDGYTSQTVTFSVSGGSTASVDIYMRRPDAVIYGRVAGPDSAWLNLVKVTAVSEWGDTVAAATNGGGNFTLNCREADWTVTMEKAGYRIPRAQKITLRQGDNHNLGTAYLERNPNMLSGVVRNSGGASVMGAKVRVLREGVLVEELASTPQSGAYSFSLPSGTYTLTAEKPGFAMYSRSVDLTGSRNQDITIAENAALINGTVFGKSWNAAKNMLELAPIPRAKATFISEFPPSARPDTFTVTGDAAFGKFSLSVPGGKRFNVKVEADGFADKAVKIAPASEFGAPDTTKGGQTTAFSDTLQALAMLRGKVTGGLADVDIILYDVDNNRTAASAKSSGGGGFEIRNIPDGKYVINAGKDGYYLSDGGFLSDGFTVNGGRLQPQSAEYTLTMAAGYKKIRWDVVGGYDGSGSIKVTSPLNKTVRFSGVSAESHEAALDNVGPGDYIIEAAAESDAALLQLSYRKITVPGGSDIFTDTVSFPLRHTPKDTAALDNNGKITLEVVGIAASLDVSKVQLFYRSEGSTRYDSVPAPDGSLRAAFTPDKDGCDLQYYFRVELSNGDVYGSAKQVFTSYVRPIATVVSRVSVDPGSSGDTLYLPSNYTAAFTLRAFYSDRFIPFSGSVNNYGGVRWSVGGASGSGPSFTYTTGAGTANITLTAEFTPRPPYTMKPGRSGTVRIPIRVTGAELSGLAVARSGGSGPVLNTENTSFRVEALDKNGKSVAVSPSWSRMPEAAGSIGGDGLFTPGSDFFGVVRVYASVGRMRAEYTETGAELPGLSVNYPLKSKIARDTAWTHRGLRLAFRKNSIASGESAELRAVIHSTNDENFKNSVRKGSGSFRMADSLAYDIEFSSVDKIDSAVSVIIDVPAHLRRDAADNPGNFKVAWWSDKLNWVTLPSSEVVFGGGAVAARLDNAGAAGLKKPAKASQAEAAAAEASKLQASASYAVVVQSTGLSVGLTVSPNPFSPYIRPVKEYGTWSDVPAGTCFRVNIEAPEYFVRSLKVHIYNATGKRVWAVEKFNAEVGENRIWWDGRTTSREEIWSKDFLERNNGRMCRNGRYFVTAIITDMEGRQRRVMKPLVLMK